MTFFAKNKQKAGLLSYNRADYQVRAFPENGGLGPPMIKNLDTAEMNYYGRITEVGDVIVPKPDVLVRLASDVIVGESKPYFVLPIVAAIYREIRQNMSFNLSFKIGSFSKSAL